MDLCHEDEIQDRMVRINLKNVNRVAYRSIDQGRLNRLGGAAIYFKIRLDFCDEEDRIERPVDRRMLHVDFAGFLEDEAFGESDTGDYQGGGGKLRNRIMKKAV